MSDVSRYSKEKISDRKQNIKFLEGDIKRDCGG